MKRCVLLLLFVQMMNLIFASDIEVPNLESSLQNSGNSVPLTALPQIQNPPLIDIPLPSPVETVNVKTVEITEGEILAPTPLSEDDSGTSDSKISGFVSLGVGTPGTLAGEVRLQKKYSEQQNADVSFSHESIESYSRKTRLETRVATLDTKQHSWHLGAILEEGADTNQNKNSFFSSLIRRSIAFSGSLSGFSLSGLVFSSFADEPFLRNIPVTSGYTLSPALSYAYETDFATITPSASYHYHTILEEGETHTGIATIAFAKAFSNVRLGLSTGVVFGNNFSRIEKKALSPVALFPFSVEIQLKSEKQIPQNFHLTGGLAVYRSSAWDLGGADPFVSPQGLAILASDWNVSSSYSAQVLSDLLFEFDIDYKKTAFKRGIVTATDTFEDGRFQTTQINRNSLETTIQTVWTASMMSVNAGWKSQWMDVLWQQKRHVLITGATLFDSSVHSVWESSIEAEFFPLRPEFPVISMSATIHPVRDLSLSLSYSDALPRIFGKTRMRNPVYEQQSGVIMLRGTISL